ncbi:Uncharacterised protein [uncultured archaeon]|nr:Uncharacterised protein [uncultured archaeon]
MAIEKLFGQVTDERRDRRNRRAIIFSPVGDHAQLAPFVAHMKKIGLDKKQGVDFLFIYRKGIGSARTGLSAIHALEGVPLGTSGAFFAGQAYCYEMGYDFIIVTDCDAMIDSAETFDAMLSLA